MRPAQPIPRYTFVRHENHTQSFFLQDMQYKLLLDDTGEKVLSAQSSQVSIQCPCLQKHLFSYSQEKHPPYKLCFRVSVSDSYRKPKNPIALNYKFLLHLIALIYIFLLSISTQFFSISSNAFSIRGSSVCSKSRYIVRGSTVVP